MNNNEQNLNLIIPIQFMQKYAGHKYVGQEARKANNLSKQEIDFYTHIQNEADVITTIFENLSDECYKKFGIKNYDKFIWRDGSNIKIRSYLWLQLKTQERKDSNISISIFFEKYDYMKFRYRTCIEIKDFKASKEDINNFNKLLDIQLSPHSNLMYTAVTNYTNILKIETKNKNEIRQKIKNGEYKKIQLGNILEYSEDITNQDVLDFIFNNIKELLPYYTHILSGTQKKEFPSHPFKTNSEPSLLTEITQQENKNTMEINPNKNFILYGPPGTGKTYSTMEYAVTICNNEDIKNIKINKHTKNYNEIKNQYNQLIQNKRIQFITFHQSYSYEEFIEGIKPELTNNSDTIQYKLVSGIFKEFCEYNQNHNKPCVFIIDEINRGNISKIFGELITLIEDSKRQGATNELSVILPYSKERFSVPKNIYIIGTMNTADRSIALLDTALRRRFNFIEMQPNYTQLQNIIISNDNKKLNLENMLRTINNRITVLYDREHTIGHAYFMDLIQNPTFEKLQHIFQNAIFPLLQEYFYDDYQKIQLILGDTNKNDKNIQFIVEDKTQNYFKGNELDFIDFSEKQYTINEKAFSNIESYIQIYE